MDWKESTRTIRIPKTVCNEYEERGVDLDIVLPDYCSDVTAILKCIMKPTVTSRHQSGDRYTIDGTVVVRILYLSETRDAVHCYEVTQPFSAGFRCSGGVHYFVNIKNDYIHCRAISPRRVDIHGAYRIHLCAVGEGTAQVFEDPCRREVFCQKEEVQTVVPSAEYEKTFVVTDVIHLGVNADALLYADVSVLSCEQKLLTNKAIIKGELMLKALYMKADTMQTLIQEIPFSQIVDANGLCEDSVCDTEVLPCEQECILRQNDGGTSVLDLTCKMNCFVRCSDRRTDTIVTDAYSVEEPLLCNEELLQFHSSGNRQIRRSTFQEFTSVPEGLISIEDQWCEPKSIDLREGKDGVNVCDHMTICMIGRNTDGQLGYYERALECNTLCEHSIKDAVTRIISSSCTLNGNQIRVQVDAEICFECDDSRTVSTVTGVMPDTTHPYTRSSATVRIVYADKGESVWDIAKKHHSSVDDICAENDLTDSVLRTSTMLLIPMM